MTLQCVLDGGRYFEGPRWHAGQLWFVDCMERTLLSLSPSGEPVQHAKFEDDTPCGVGVLPDGRLVVLTMYRKRLMTYIRTAGFRSTPTCQRSRPARSTT
jgi:sugar lactone lactonase YvrE